MSPRKTTGIVCAVILVSTILIVGLLYRSNVNEASDLLAQYNKNTQHFDKTQTSTVIEEIRDKDGGPPDFTPTIPIPGVPQPNPSPAPMPNPEASDFLEALSIVHHLYGHSGLKYQYGGSGTLTNGDSVRTDCSGYVSYALAYYGVFSHGTVYSSSNFYTAPGLTEVTSNIHSEGDLQAGDILCYNGHVEVYAGNGKIYNWGGSSSAEDKYTSCRGHDFDTCTVDARTNFSRSFATITHVMRIQ